MSWPQGAGKCQPSEQTLALMDKKRLADAIAVIGDMKEIAGMDLLALAARLEDNLCHRQCDCPRPNPDDAKDCIQLRAANVLRAAMGQSVSRPNCGGAAK